MEIQQLSPLNVKPNKPSGNAKPTKPARGATASNNVAGKAANAGPTPGEALISVSSSVADSNGIDLSNSHLSFAVDTQTGSTILNIVDSETGEVIRQIPPSDILKLKKTMGAVQGLVLDRKASTTPA